MTRTTFSALLVAAMAMPALACDLCAVYSATQAPGETGKGFFLGLAEQFTHYGSVQEEGQGLPNDAHQYLDSSISQIFLGYNFAPRWGLQWNVPVIYRAFERPDDSGGIDRGTESGLGDASLLAHLSAYRKESADSAFHWNFFGGVKFPTGSTRRLQEEVDELTAPAPLPGVPLSGIHGHDLALGQRQL